MYIVKGNANLQRKMFREKNNVLQKLGPCMHERISGREETSLDTRLTLSLLLTSPQYKLWPALPDSSRGLTVAVVSGGALWCTVQRRCTVVHCAHCAEISWLPSRQVAFLKTLLFDKIFESQPASAANSNHPPPHPPQQPACSHEQRSGVKGNPNRKDTRIAHSTSAAFLPFLASSLQKRTR